MRTGVAYAVALLVVATAAESQSSDSVLRSQQSRPPLGPVVPSPDFQRAVAHGTRTTTGVPGPAYWQQWTDYSLWVRLDPIRKRIDGDATIVYHNRSPDTLPVLALQLAQNLHAAGVPRNEPGEVTGGVELTRVADDSGRRLPYHVDGTVLLVRPPAPVGPGATVTLSIAWNFRVPQQGAGARMGWSGDDFYHLAYWYPQMAVYDDVVGWQVDPFLSRAEFYAGFGSYDLRVEAPEGWVIHATGSLVNPEEVLTDLTQARLARAERSDTAIHILTENDLGPGRATRRHALGTLTWRFHADSVRDLAFSATRASLWDAARTPVGDRDGDGDTDYARVDAVYRANAPRWQHVWRYAQHAIDFLSRFTGIPYPWSHMTAVEGAGIIGGGMEFPMMTLIGDYNERGDSALYYVTAHELAHMWVPMIVATDERRHSWMDEGTTTFNENQARKEFFPGVNHDLSDQQTYIAMTRSGAEGELMRWADYHYSGEAFGVASYQKPASLLAALRGLLGDDVFLAGYRAYLSAWAYRHPKPWDFFHAFDEAAGRDLSWFWRAWYYETWTLDHAVADVESAGGETRITIEDRGWAPMPARLAITLADGEVIRREIPVETWLAGETTAFVAVETAATAVRVEIDPEQLFPDVDRENNVWTSTERRDLP
jgi:hypothetical protein